jgi:pimeloyl-ACP methyl ester carboxylesterase
MFAQSDMPSIAVLAFNNMSGDPEQEYFSDGISEDIITDLSKLSELRVIARNSTFTYNGKPVDVKQVGRELGVRYVLEGSVRKAGNRVVRAAAASTVRRHAECPSCLLSLERGLLPTLRAHTQMISNLKKFRRPVRIIFGDADPSLNSGVAQAFHELFSGSELFLLPGAQHFVQLDEPEQVARLILAMPGPGSTPA